jgi:acetyl esterase/lipase
MHRRLWIISFIITATAMAAALPARATVSGQIAASYDPSPALAPPDDISTPTLGSAPSSGLYIDPVFDVSLTHDGIVYGQAVNVDGVLQDLVLNVYQPVGSHPDDTAFESAHRPVIVWAPGGGFVYNRGRTRTYWMLDLVRRGYVVVSIEYRVRPDLPYAFSGFLTDPARFVDLFEASRDGQHDMQAAVRWVRAHADDIGVDSDRIVAAGYSAGAVIALETAFDPDDPGTSGNPGYPSDVVAAISGAGYYVPGVMGSIDAGEPPIMVLHGTNDTALPMLGSLIPCAATLALGNVCEAHLFPGEPHDVADWRGDEMLAFSVDFLYRHVIAPTPLLSLIP